MDIRQAVVPDQIPLCDEDCAILALECATVVGHTCKIIGLAPDGVDVEGIRLRIASRLGAAPVLTRKLGGGPDEPCWVPDPDFDIARHVVAVPGPPVDASGLRQLVGELFPQHLDRAHPLWRMDVARLTDGGTALIWRLHHALADGTTIVRWCQALLWDEVAQTTPASHAARHAADEERRRAHLAGFVSREFARSRHRSPFDGKIGTRREIGLATLPLSALKRAAHTLGGATVNDALLSVVGGAVRRYIEMHHGSLSDIRVRVPVSLHHDGDAALNRDSFFSIPLPLHIADPVERLHVVRAETALRKRAHDAEHEDALLHGLSKAVPLQRFVERLNDSPRRFAVSVSNVPGPKAPVSIAGVPVTLFAGLAEIGMRHGLRVAAVSLHEDLNLGLCSDPSLVPGVQSMADAALIEARALVVAADH